MTLLSEVVGVLQRAGIAHALIGAAAMAVHGVSRATADVDLPKVDRSVLLRLDAGGPKDAWDVQSLLEGLEPPREIGAEVDRVIPRLAPAARRLWKRLRDAG